jgi:hypothetical protein
MSIRSKLKPVMLKTGVIFAICVGATAFWQGVSGHAAAPAVAEQDFSPTFSKLRSGPYQENVFIRVIEDPI